jgi:excisionase family DNA binding protein
MARSSTALAPYSSEHSDSPWLDARQIAARIGVSERTVRGWTARGIIPHVRLPGRLVRYRVDEIDAWVASFGVAPVRGARR